MQGKDLREFIPLMPIENPDDECVVSKRGDITFGWRIFLPVAYTVNEPGYDSIINSFVQAYKLLPPYCIVHKQDIYKNDTYKPEEQDEFLMQCYEKNAEGRKFLNGYCYLFLTFSTKSIIEMNSEGSGMFGFPKARFPKPEQIKKDAGIASQFESILGNNPCIRVVPLKAGDFIHMGSHGEDEGLLADYLNLFPDQPNLNYPMKFYDSYMTCGSKVVKAWFVEDSDAYPGTVSSASLINEMSSGVTKVFLSGGSPIGYQLKMPHIVNRYVITLPRKTVEKELNSKKRVMTSFSLYSAQDRVNAEELDKYLEAAASSSAITTKCFTDVIAWGEDSELPEIRNKIVTAFANLDMVVCEETRIMPTLYYAGIPGAAAELGYNYMMTSEINSFLCHGLWDGYNNGIEGGAIKVDDRQRMIPVKIDMQTIARDKGYINDLNGVVIGPSGSGKSYTVNLLLNCMYAKGSHILVIDIGDSYQGLFRVINEETGGRDGIYNTYDPNNPLQFNPFRGYRNWGSTVIKDEDDHKEDSDEKTGNEESESNMRYVLSLIKTMYEPAGGWTKDKDGILQNLLNQFFSLWENGYSEKLSNDLKEAYINSRRARAQKMNKKFDEKNAGKGFLNPLGEIFDEKRRRDDPIFNDFYRYVTEVVAPLVKDENMSFDRVNVRMDMFDMDAFGMAISKYKLDGTYGFLLNATEEKDLFASAATCYEVDKIKDNDDLFPLWLLSIMHSFETKMRTLQCPKVMVIEEAWSAIAKPTMAKFIEWLWRTARKFKTSAIIVTQSATDLTSSPIIKDAIINNSSTKILLDQSKNANKFNQTAEMFGFRQMDVNLVLSVNKALNPGYKYKEAFVAIGEHYSNVFGIEVSLEQALAYESEKTKKKIVLDRAAQTGSIIRAIKEIAQEIREGKIKW